MRGFYGQRCGGAVNMGAGYAHPPCHRSGAYHVTSGKSGPCKNQGGWHDAGDYGRYIVNSGIATGTLLWAWELFPRVLAPLSLDNANDRPGKLPDFLAETRWNLEWMLSLQDGDGGVWHKQTSEYFSPFVMPQADTLTSYVIGTGRAPFKSTCATADFAAVMAIAARCYAAADGQFSQRCLRAARAAWRWAVEHPQVTFRNPPSISTGAYADDDCRDEIAWASAELWRTTGEPLYEHAFLSGMAASSKLTIDAPNWANLWPLACWTYVLARPAGDHAVKERIREATLEAAASLIDRTRSSGYGNTLAPA